MSSLPASMDGEQPLVCFGAVSDCGDYQYDSWITTHGRIYMGTDHTGEHVYKGEPRADFDINHANMLAILSNRLMDLHSNKPRSYYSSPDNLDNIE